MCIPDHPRLKEEKSMKETKSQNKILGQLNSCSTFMWNTDNAFLIGHNLDEYSEVDLPGAVLVNQRGQTKTSKTFFEMFTGTPSSGPRLTWVARHGSVTLNTFGKDFPDGGINEAGLYVQEMSLAVSKYPESSNLTCMFMSLWIQYALDNFTTVQEVIDSLSNITIDGLTWHFFVCDTKGNTASIDWINRKPVVHTGEEMPHTVLTNYAYDDELATLKPYQGFGGDKLVDLSDMGDGNGIDTRFIHACHLIRTGPTDPGIDDAYKILYAMDRAEHLGAGGRHWSYVIDSKAGRLYIETRSANQRRFIDIKSLDFSKPTQMVELHLNQEGDITNCLQPMTHEINRQMAQKNADWMDVGYGFSTLPEEEKKEWAEISAAFGIGTFEILIDSICAYADQVQTLSTV